MSCQGIHYKLKKKKLPPEIWRIILKDKLLECSSGLLRHVCRLFRDILYKKRNISVSILSTVPLIKWACANNYNFDWKTSVVVAKNGDLELLQWLRSNGCGWNWQTCAGAAKNGHLEVLQWLRANGCRWNWQTCAGAAGNGHLEVLQWAHSNGCEMNDHTCTRAAEHAFGRASVGTR